MRIFNVELFKYYIKLLNSGISRNEQLLAKINAISAIVNL